MKSRIKLAVAAVLFMFAIISSSQAGVSPSSVNIVRGQSNTLALVYQFGGLTATSCRSSEGTFSDYTDIIELGKIYSPLHTMVTHGSVTVTETLVIPTAIAERAVQQGSARFRYKRTFFCPPDLPRYFIVHMTVTGESIGQFGIKRISLYFENGRAETTVQKNITGLKAFADISYIGSGLLKGYWEVDGRMLSQVNRPLMSGQSVTLDTPDIPPLPTFEAGTHTVRFVITSPAQGIPLPSLVYFVSADESVLRPMALMLKAPAEKSVLPYGTIKFQWEEYFSALYLVQYFEKPDDKPVFSAYTLKTYYKLPDVVLKNIFQRERDYYWKVTGFDKQKRRTGESATSRFRFK